MTVVVSSAVRTPIGAFQGSLARLKASELGAASVAEAVKRAGLDPGQISSVLMGNVLSAGMGQAPARQAALYAGLGHQTPAVTLNKMCGSGMEAIVQAARAVALGEAEVVVAGGMESMSRAPYLVPGAREGLRLGNRQLIDSMVYDGLWDVYSDRHMGSCAEMCAAKYNFSREQQDAFAVSSYERAQRAAQDGSFASEIVPVEVGDPKGDARFVREDEGPFKVDFDRLPSLRPAFEEGGTVTAANASTINDGAAALILTSEAFALDRGLPVIARIRGYAGHASAPEWFTTAPVAALRKLFERLSWRGDTVELFEINEAFSVVPMAAAQELDLPLEKVNVHGGAVALGHPIGASGARIVVTLLNALRRRGQSRGVAAICIGGGEALALGVEIP
ncbi:MAG: thiolase family protein [Trueperaceae bacterium]|nr:MAG: thiolase family protein [Trueperaceae bacterium]